MFDGEGVFGTVDEVHLSEATWEVKRAVRDRDWKFIQSYEPDPHGRPMQELFDLRNDPTEQVNLAESMPEKVAEMKARLAAVGLEPAAETLDRTNAYIKAEVAKWTKVVEVAPTFGLPPDFWRYIPTPEDEAADLETLRALALRDEPLRGSRNGQNPWASALKRAGGSLEEPEAPPAEPLFEAPERRKPSASRGAPGECRRR